jgi:hypothetical protein
VVDAANAAVKHHLFWKKEFERLEFRLGRSRAIVAIARKLLITVWHVLTNEIADKHHDARDVACSLFKLAYAVKVRNLRASRARCSLRGTSSTAWGLARICKRLPGARSAPSCRPAG